MFLIMYLYMLSNVTELILAVIVKCVRCNFAGRITRYAGTIAIRLPSERGSATVEVR